MTDTAATVPLPDGRHQTFDPDSGVLLNEVEVRDGQLNGPACFFQNGQPAMRLTFVNGLKHGPAEVLLNGHPQSRLMFENDVLQGPLETLDPASGLPTAVIPHVAGKPEGEARYADPDGNLVRTETFKAGLRDGVATDFLPDGKRLAERHFAAGLPDGRHVTFYPDGKPQEVRLYQAGKLIGREIYGPDGRRMVAQGTLAPPPPAGPWWKRLLTTGKG